MSAPEGDPGWRSAWRHLLPGWSVGRRHPGDGLERLRGVFLSFAVALVLIGWVVFVLEGTETSFGSVAETPTAAAVLATGGLALAASRALDRPLDCTSDGALVKSYVQRFFLRVALAESAALAGFVGFMLSSAGWLYAVGGVPAAIGFARLAPTASRLARDQEQLAAAGCSRSLVAALRQIRTER